MKIVIAGGTGFLGTPLVSQLRAGGNDVFVLTRGQAGAGLITWSPNGTIGPWAAAIDGADVVINLAGESIAGRRWTEAHKVRIRDSRILATRSIVSAIHAAARKPRMLVNASAVGYYGSRGNETLTEESAPGSDFLATVCRAWRPKPSQRLMLRALSFCARRQCSRAMAARFRRWPALFDSLSADRSAQDASTGHGSIAMTG